MKYDDKKKSSPEYFAAMAIKGKIDSYVSGAAKNDEKYDEAWDRWYNKAFAPDDPSTKEIKEAEGVLKKKLLIELNRLIKGIKAKALREEVQNLVDQWGAGKVIETFGKDAKRIQTAMDEYNAMARKFKSPDLDPYIGPWVVDYLTNGLKTYDYLGKPKSQTDFIQKKAELRKQDGNLDEDDEKLINKIVDWLKKK